MKVRDAEVIDAEQLVRLHYDAVHSIGTDFYPKHILGSWSPVPDSARILWMRDTIVSALTGVSVVEVDGAIGGFSIFSLNEGFIRALYVAPRNQGRGLGRLLLSHAEERLATAGYREVRLNASANAVSFYRAAGYRALHATTQALADGSLLDCTTMVRVIGSM